MVVLLEEDTFQDATVYIDSENQIAVESGDFKEKFSLPMRLKIWWLSEEPLESSDFHREDYCLSHVIKRVKHDCQEILKNPHTHEELQNLLNNLRLLENKAQSHNQKWGFLSFLSENQTCYDLNDEIRQVEKIITEKVSQ